MTKEGDIRVSKLALLKADGEAGIWQGLEQRPKTNRMVLLGLAPPRQVIRNVGHSRSQREAQKDGSNSDDNNLKAL